MEIAQETYNLFQFISFCHHSLLLWRRQHCALCTTPTIDVDVAYFRFWHVAPLTFRNCPCAVCRVHVPGTLCPSLSPCACPCRPVPLPGTLCLSPVPSMSISIDSLSLASRLPWLPFGGRRPRHNLSSAKKNKAITTTTKATRTKTKAERKKANRTRRQTQVAKLSARLLRRQRIHLAAGKVGSRGGGRGQAKAKQAI